MSASRTYTNRAFAFDSDDDTPPPKPKPRAPRSEAEEGAKATTSSASSASMSEGAQLCLRGDQAYFGLGAPQSYANALQLYVKAAEGPHSHPPAMHRVGVCYRDGRGVEKDPVTAMRWFQRGVDAGDADAINAVGCAWEAGNVEGFPRDYEQAGEFYQRAADKGQVDAQTNLGFLYEKGLGVSRNAAAAAHWYRVAAEAGYAKAQNNLGALYYSGNNVAQDYAEAARWYAKGAAQGNASALNNLAICYEDGNGVAQDLTRARQLYSAAAEQGHMHANNNLGFICMMQQDYVAAATHFTAAADKGNADAMHNLGSLHENGLGVPKDAQEAYRMYRKAAALGQESARESVDRLAPLLAAEGAASARGGGGVGGGLGSTAEVAQLRKELAAKVAETERLAKELGASKAECSRLKGEVAVLKSTSTGGAGGVIRSSSPAAGALVPIKSPGGPVFDRSTSIRSNYSNVSGVSGFSNVSGSGSGPVSGPITKQRRVSESARLQATMRASVTKSSGKGGLTSMFSTSYFKSSGGPWDKNKDKELTKAHSREVNRLTAELAEMAFKAELHEDMSLALSDVLKTAYTRNLQLEDLLRGAGVDVNNETTDRELVPLKIDSIAGFEVRQLEAGHECPDGHLRGIAAKMAGGSRGT